MPGPISRLLLFCGVSAAACFASIGSIGVTLDGLSKATSAAPVIQRPLKPSYIAVMPQARADALNIAKATVVAYRAPVAVVVPTEPTTTAVAEAPTFTHTVGVESLRVREAPIKTSRQLFALKGGAAVTVSKSERGWVMITDATGRSGWVYGKMLNPTEELVAAAD